MANRLTDQHLRLLLHFGRTRKRAVRLAAIPDVTPPRHRILSPAATWFSASWAAPSPVAGWRVSSPRPWPSRRGTWPGWTRRSWAGHRHRCRKASISGPASPVAACSGPERCVPGRRSGSRTECDRWRWTPEYICASGRPERPIRLAWKRVNKWVVCESGCGRTRNPRILQWIDWWRSLRNGHMATWWIAGWWRGSGRNFGDVHNAARWRNDSRWNGNYGRWLDHWDCGLRWYDALERIEGAHGAGGATWRHWWRLLPALGS